MIRCFSNTQALNETVSQEQHRAVRHTNIHAPMKRDILMVEPSLIRISQSEFLRQPPKPIRPQKPETDTRSHSHYQACAASEKAGRTVHIGMRRDFSIDD